MKFKKLIENIINNDYPDIIYTPNNELHSGKELLNNIQVDQLQGGVADGITEEEAARMLGVSINDVNDFLNKGEEVEMEHTNNRAIARRIALDHLLELKSLKYYDELEKLEKKLKLQQKEKEEKEKEEKEK